MGKLRPSTQIQGDEWYRDGHYRAKLGLRSETATGAQSHRAMKHGIGEWFLLVEDKTSVRMMLGVVSLPLGMPVAVEVILEVEA